MPKGHPTNSGGDSPTVEFADLPPAAARGRGPAINIDKVVVELQARPGQWAIVARDVKRNVEAWKRRGCRTEFRKNGNVDEKGIVLGTLYASWPVAGQADVADEVIDNPPPAE